MKRLLLILFLLPSCAQAPREAKVCPRWTAENLVYASKLSAEKSMEADNPADKVGHAKKGLNWAEKCVASFPKEAGCYFYRAVNQGLYIQTTMIKHQKGLSKMIADCEKVVELDSNYDNGGAYRILGNIYLKAPQFTLKKSAVHQDIDLATEYAKKAMNINNADLDNRMLWGEVLFEQEKYLEAREVFSRLIADLVKIKPLKALDRDNLEQAQKLFLKAEKKLTK